MYRPQDWFVFVLTNLFALLAIVGNGFVCYVIYKRKRSSTTFLLIGSQAFSDCLYGILRALSFLVCSTWFANLSRGALALCEWDITLFLSCFAVSSLSMTAIAIDRFMRLYMPHRQKPTRTQTFLVVLAIWIIAVTSCFLGMVGIKTRQYFGSDHFVTCFIGFQELANYAFFDKAHGYWTFTVLIFYFPMIATGILYAFIIYKVKKIRPFGVTNEDRLKRSQMQRERTIKMLITIVVVYYFLASPITYITQAVVIRTGKHITCGKGNVFSLPFVAINMILISTVINPVILCWFNETFSMEIKRLLGMSVNDSDADGTLTTNSNTRSKSVMQSTSATRV